VEKLVENPATVYKEYAESVLRPRFMFGISAGIGLAVTVLILAVPTAASPHRNVSLHVAVETTAALIALLAAYLVFGRFQQRAHINDLALVCALVIFGLTNLLFRTVPAVMSATVEVGGAAVWTPLISTALGGILFALAAFAPDARVTRPGRYVVTSLVVVLVSLTAIVALVEVIPANQLAPNDPVPTPSSRADLFADPALSAAHLFAAALFAAAAFGFSRRGKAGDDLMNWFAAGAVLAAFARLDHALFPSSYVGWVYLADLLRLGFYFLLLVGAAREIRRYWSRFAEAAILDERRRIARELHDGIAQELAYVVAQAKQASKYRDTREVVEKLSVVAQRALDDSRRAIVALVGPLNQPLAAALEQTADEVAERTGIPITLDLAEDVDVTPATRETLIRIVREAAVNAVRHGEANHITVRLTRDSQMHLEIADDGVGFDARIPTRDRFGLVSMKERTHALGGEFRISSQPGDGTKVEVVLP
jgi:signal transduction histidine kinase